MADELWTSGAPQSELLREVVAAHRAAEQAHAEDHNAWRKEGGWRKETTGKAPPGLRPEPQFDGITFDLCWLCARLDTANRRIADLERNLAEMARGKR